MELLISIEKKISLERLHLKTQLIGENLGDPGYGDDFLDITSKEA